MRGRLAGLMLIAMGAALGLQASGRLPAVATAGVVAAAGAAVLVGRPWARWLGLVVSGLGLAFMVFVESQANGGHGRQIAEQFFADAEGHFSWIDVAMRSIAFAAGFALSGGLLIAPFTAASRGQSGTENPRR